LPQLRDLERRQSSKNKRTLSDLPLLAGLGSLEPSVESPSASEHESDEHTTQFPGLRL
jgi:hypothetical protein